jgi:hypothetical protein
MIRKRAVLVFLTLLLTNIPAFAQDLSIGLGDFQLEQQGDEGFHLFIRKKPDIASVLLTESTRDPAMGADNFAYRSPEWNPVNGNEIRILNGVPIPRENGIFSLISSTPEAHPELGEAFHIFVPWVVHYGYEGVRNGEVQMTDGTYINIRAFSLPYADYRGSFADNPFVLQAVQIVPEEQKGKPLDEAEKSFREIAQQGRGDFVYASSPPELLGMIESLLKKEAGKEVDLVLCLDTTGSMAPYIDGIRKMLIPMMMNIIAEFTGFRIGMVLYRDYPPDTYVTKLVPFTKDFSIFQRYLNAAVTWGGGDIPEAVYEALYDGADKFPWAAESRLIILVGDAPPHPKPRGIVSREMVYGKATEKDLKLSAILLPQEI